MKEEKWEEMKEEMARRFEIEKEGFEDLLLEKEDGTDVVGSAEFFIFQSPLGRTKISREKRPIHRHAATHRSGQAIKHDEDSDDGPLPDFSYKIKVYKWSEDNDEWTEIDGSAFA